MSARAIRKLREDREAALAREADEDEESDDSDEEVVSGGGGGGAQTAKSAFALMNDSSSDEEDEEDGDKSVEGEKEEQNPEEDVNTKSPTIDSNSKEKAIETNKNNVQEEEEEEDNLDALLEEFKEHDELNPNATTDETNGMDGLEPLACFQVLTSGVDIRDLDVDHVMKTSLLTAEPVREATTSNTRKRRNRQTFLFGNPRDLNVNVKPPHYVGGGIGMSTYDRDTEAHRTIPWPYSNNKGLEDMMTGGFESSSMMNVTTWQALQDRRRWFTFLQSDSYDKDCQDFLTIQASGDINALVLFVAHHPFVTEALVTVGMMLYHQANSSQEGLTFLRRALWVYESATLSSFASRVFCDSCLMDYDQRENKTYFQALFRLARVNNMAGLPRASIAIAKYLLSLDPLRDPTGVLLAMDSYALNTNLDANDQWIVDLVESREISVFYKDESTGREYRCDLLDLPNWAYSYALALYRVNDSRPSEKANEALQNAISRFPTVVDLLLSENDVDIASRSCRIDWQAVIDYTGTRANEIHGSTATGAESTDDPVVRMATDKAYDLISRIYAKLNNKFWGGDSIMLWLHNNLEALKKSSEPRPVTPLSPALMRYSRVDMDDYQTKFQLLPAEANPLDPGLVQHALVIDPNRRRFLRNQQRGGQQRGGGDFNIEDLLFGQGNAAVRPTLFGPPTNIIDLDWPMLEVFWRSLLPWNRIEEIPRPRP